MPLRAHARSALRRAGLDLVNRPERTLLPFALMRIQPVGPIKRQVHGPGLFAIETDRCTSFAGLPFSQSGWNPLVVTLREFGRNELLRYEESTLGRLHRRFRPRTVQDFLLPDAPGQLAPLDEWPLDRRLFRYIWDIDSRSLRAATASPGRTRSRNYYYGPMPTVEGKREFDRLITTFRSIRADGYRPHDFAPITGYFIGAGDDFRFVVGSGNHRMAALAALGAPRVNVALHSHPAVVPLSQLTRWTVGHGGLFAPDTAHALFALYVHGEGRDVAALVENAAE